MDTTNREPQDDVVAKALLQALLEIHIYRSRHAMDELKQVSIKALAAAGVFSPQTVTFLKNHQARFYGFPKRIAPDIVVLDMVTAGKRFIGFSDGHVERQAHEDRPAVCAQDAV
jgi:hypothetical protein